MLNLRLLLTALIAFFLSCDSNIPISLEYQIIGKWKLVEQLADPGDGSGEFRPVDRNKIINFNSDGTISSNASLCTFGTGDKSQSSGTYTVQPNSINVTCGENQDSLGYSVNEDGKLEIWYYCIEGCAERYINLTPNSF